MRIDRLPQLAILFFAMGLIAVGCSPFGPGTQRETKFYVLSSLQSEEVPTQPLGNLSNIAIGVGPIRLPMYLDRSDIVTRGSLNKVEIADFSQWAGPLPENFSRVLAENLSVLLSTDKIAIFPFTRQLKIDFSVGVYVTRFDGMPGDKAYLRARWGILGNKRKESFFEKHTITSHPTENDTIEALIAAKSQTVSDLSREIARAMIEVSLKHPPQRKE